MLLHLLKDNRQAKETAGIKFEEGDGQCEFLNEGTNMQFLVEQINQSSGVNPVTQGLAAYILGLCYEFNDDSEPVFSRANVQGLKDQVIDPKLAQRFILITHHMINAVTTVQARDVPSPRRSGLGQDSIGTEPTSHTHQGSIGAYGASESAAEIEKYKDAAVSLEKTWENSALKDRLRAHGEVFDEEADDGDDLGHE
ncbi:hypothetical protein BSLG_003673 [Batrachochytrium salamandrivorans]|nr:hypothetical protein BSLG_003673 [Batrachochytrium salamandrivorans]